MQTSRRLPPGQRRIKGFPRFGHRLSQPPPVVPVNPVIKISGAVTEEFELPLAALATLDRKELTADFHCVAGWSATDLLWEGVSFQTVYRACIEPALRPGVTITHLEFGGLDGWRSVVTLEDALSDDVLIAERLDGRPLNGDHGAPARLVSPKQYGYMNTKHLCRIGVLTAEPKSEESRLGRLLVPTHPRARVWQEERHFLPLWIVRPFYRALIAPIRFLSARGGQQDRDVR